MPDNSPTPPDSRKFPPLAWIILAAAILIGAVMVFGPDKTNRFPSGETYPAESGPPGATTSGQDASATPPR